MNLALQNGFQIELSTLTIVALLIIIVFLVRKAYQIISGKRVFKGKSKVKEFECDYQEADEVIAKAKKPVIAIFEIHGIILNESKSSPPALFGQATFGADLGETLETLSKNDHLGAILLKFNTPGGTIAGSDSIAKGLQKCSDAGKFTLSYISELSASGGVWAMTPSMHIIANSHATIGSIGVRGPSIMHYTGVREVGKGLFGERVSATSITSRTLYEGKGKDFGNPFTEPEPETIEHYQTMLRRIYCKFLDHLKTHRDIDKKTLENRGALLLDTHDAQELGIIDEIGDFNVAKKCVSDEIGSLWDDCIIVHINLSRKNRLRSLVSSFILSCFPTLKVRMLQSVLSRFPVIALAQELL